ncbi:MAG: hypothetical protein U1E05_24225 [Patescibacteria group bacterium]|nr:hypothetical protein [Patescibacteria group bacterium]
MLIALRRRRQNLKGSLLQLGEIGQSLVHRAVGLKTRPEAAAFLECGEKVFVVTGHGKHLRALLCPHKDVHRASQSASFTSLPWQPAEVKVETDAGAGCWPLHSPPYQRPTGWQLPAGPARMSHGIGLQNWGIR